jgi:ketopantoate reductase
LDEGLDLLHGRFGVIGAGAMGLSLAAALGASGPVTLVCREPALAERIRAHGATVRGLGSAHANPDVVPSISRLADHGPVHAVFVATKTSAIEQVASELRPVLSEIGPGGIIPFIVSFQNGIETGRQLMERLGETRVLRMVLNYGARERLWSMIESARPHTPSMVEDIREGRTSEVGQLNRQVIAHGERTGVATPTHRVVTALIDAFDWRVFRRKPAQRPPLA